MQTETATSDTKYCQECGSEISTKAEICPDCGVSQDGNRVQQGRDPSNRFTAAIIGSIPSFFFGWLPILGPMFGGFVAGYLRGQDKQESALTGTIANIIASIPFFLFAVFGVFAQIVEGTVDTFIGWVFLCVISLMYFYGCGAFGGWAGAAFSDRAEP